MTIIGQLEPGIAQIVDRKTSEEIGFAFTLPSGAGQLQRWLLYRNPQNAFDVRPAPASMAGWSLSDWQASIPNLWRPGSLYIWAQSDVYEHGGTYHGETWTSIPLASRLPLPRFPEVVLPESLQLDPCLTGVECLQEQARGFVYTLGGLSEDLSVEYWMLPAQYQPAGKSGTTSVAVGTEQTRSFQEFIDLANRSWGPGCCFVITGCRNYPGKSSAVPPASP